MKAYKFVLEGEVPSKKNSRILSWRGGRVVNVPSKRYQDWEKRVLLELSRGVKFDRPVRIECRFWVGSNRRTDIDNKLASIFDALQKAGVISDDRWQVVGQISGKVLGIRKGNPSVEVLVEELPSIMTMEVGEYEMSNLILLEAVLGKIEEELDRVMWNITQEEYNSPFENTGNEFTELKEFKVRAYDWGWDSDESGEKEPLPNFEWRDYKLWWYKHSRRGLYANREITNDELAEMAEESVSALRKYEEENES